MSQRLRSIVPQSPGVAVAMCTSQPAPRRRINVPAQSISASSGWARKLRATFRKAAAFYRQADGRAQGGSAPSRAYHRRARRTARERQSSPEQAEAFAAHEARAMSDESE